MSLCYWWNEGIGVRCEDIYPILDDKKCIAEIRAQLPDEEIDEEGFDIDDYFYGEPFENLADLLCHVDDSGLMTYGDTGDGEYFFFYTPSYPWERRENEPQSIEEVHEHIINAVLRLSSATREQIEAIIDNDISEVGYG